MNIYVVRQATQGLANWVKTQGGKQLVAISYDSRINSDVFAKTAASVLAANGDVYKRQDQACEDKIKEDTTATSRCMPFKQDHIADTCVCCGKPAKALVYWGKAY